MKTLALRNIGRFGNRMFRYAHARALCDQNGHELRTELWGGEKIFTLDGATHARPDGTEDFVMDGYCQNQQSLIYTRADCRRWFTFRPEIIDLLKSVPVYNLPYAHFRRGDYASANYPLVGSKSVELAMLQFGIHDPCVPVSDDTPTGGPEFSGGLEFLPDFYRLMTAPILFRANSSFSYWASVLGNGRTFSPVITGLAGGVEHDNVLYVEGNHPALADLPNITELYLSE